MRCPVCRADNDDAVCRRCRADLMALFALEEERTRALAAAALAASQGDGTAVVRHAEAALRLRHGDDALRWQALGFLLQRQFPQALGCYLKLRASV